MINRWILSLYFKVRDNYDLLSDSTWKLIDADQTMDNVHEAIYKIIEEEVRDILYVIYVIWEKVVNVLWKLTIVKNRE